MTITSINPATGQPIREYPLLEGSAIRRTVAAADRAFASWRRTPLSERSAHLRAAARILRERTSEFGRLIATEMGKAVREARPEVEKCAWVCEFYADHAEAMLAREPVELGTGRSFVTLEPLGVILAIMPWNFPFWQVFRFAAPTLLAGNVALLKHASNVPGCALAIEEVFRQAGFPAGVFGTLLIDNRAARGVIRHRLVRGVSLTGSTAAGRDVAATAGRNLKRSVLELGGSDPYLILKDADLDLAARVCAAARLINAGQSCIAAKRFVVVEAVREEFERRLIAQLQAARVGDPLAEETTVGPLARRDLRDQLHDQVRRSREAGARCLLGGEPVPGDGAYYPPTLLTGVDRRNPAAREELFGPVAAILPVRNERAAIQTANDSSFGLGAAVFTRDLERGEHIAATELEAGCCFVNEAVRSDPRLPFGGIRDSGYGRELSWQGIREFVNVKSVHVRLDA